MLEAFMVTTSPSLHCVKTCEGMEYLSDCSIYCRLPNRNIPPSSSKVQKQFSRLELIPIRLTNKTDEPTVRQIEEYDGSYLAIVSVYFLM